MEAYMSDVPIFSPKQAALAPPVVVDETTTDPRQAVMLALLEGFKKGLGWRSHGRRARGVRSSAPPARRTLAASQTPPSLERRVIHDDRHAHR
jgi:hypothetical protein